MDNFNIDFEGMAKTSVQANLLYFDNKEEAKKYVESNGFNFDELLENGEIDVYYNYDDEEKPSYGVYLG